MKGYEPDPDLTPAQRALFERLIQTGEHADRVCYPIGHPCSWCGRPTDFAPWGTNNVRACRFCFVQIKLPAHKPGDPISAVAGYFPEIERDFPIAKPFGRGTPVTDRRIGVKGYSGRDVKSFAHGGAGLTFGR